MVTHSSILAWRTPMTEEPGGLQSTESQRVGHNRVTRHSTAQRRPAEREADQPFSEKEGSWSL